MIFANEGTERLWKRQHGLLKCKVCGKKLKRFSSKDILEERINGKIHMAYLVETSGFSGLDVIDNHLNCLKLKQEVGIPPKPKVLGILPTII